MIKNNKAFTLVEFLVAVAVFSVVIGIASGIFLSGLQAQRKALATQELVDQTGYVLDYMSRAIRMARKELSTTTPACLVEDSTILTGHNYQITRGGKGLRFINYQNTCQEFFWDQTSNQLKELKGGIEEFLTSDDLGVVSLNFKLAGESEEDTDQPRATVFLEMKGRGLKPEQQPEIKIQTTISQRSPDIER